MIIEFERVVQLCNMGLLDVEAEGDATITVCAPHDGMCVDIVYDIYTLAHTIDCCYNDRLLMMMAKLCLSLQVLQALVTMVSGL
jgi:hypothetical protein